MVVLGIDSASRPSRIDTVVVLEWSTVSIVLLWAMVVMVVMNVICMVVAMVGVDYVGKSSDVATSFHTFLLPSTHITAPCLFY
jgi:hypothetical protein